MHAICIFLTNKYIKLHQFISKRTEFISLNFLSLFIFANVLSIFLLYSFFSFQGKINYGTAWKGFRHVVLDIVSSGIFFFFFFFFMVSSILEYRTSIWVDMFFPSLTRHIRFISRHYILKVNRHQGSARA